MRCSRHALLRYCTRVLNIEEEEEANTYLEDFDMKVEISKELRNRVEDSTWFWYGSHIQDNADTLRDYFYHKDGYIIALREGIIVTLWHPNYGYTTRINKIVSDELFKEILKLQKKQKFNPNIDISRLALKLINMTHKESNQTQVSS